MILYHYSPWVAQRVQRIFYRGRVTWWQDSLLQCEAGAAVSAGGYLSNMIFLQYSCVRSGVIEMLL